MTYVDTQYISVARKSEVQHHEYTMDQLQAKIAYLTRSVAWELEQHHSRLKELQQAEDTLAMSDSSTAITNTQPTLAPIPSSRRKRTQSKKNVHREIQQPVAQLVA